MQITIERLDKPTRLDRTLRERFPEWGRQAVQQLIAGGKVLVNGRKVWLCSWLVQNQDRLEVLEMPAAKPVAPTRFEDGWLIAADAELIVVNKPAGLLAETPHGRTAVSLLELASARFGPLILFHRLDRDTSGLLLLTRPGPINQYLDAAFKTRRVQKEYWAVVAKPNRLEDQGVIHARLDTHPKRRDRMIVVERGGQHAVTRYAIADEADGKQLVRLWPETGRTHQLRVHLAHLGAPILGDRLYGPPPDPGQRLMLHAYRITLPAMDAYPERSFTAPLPDHFWSREEILAALAHQ